MNSKLFAFLLCLSLLAIFASCNEGDGYEYPPVKQEFLTARTGADGNLYSVLTDEGKSYGVAQDASNTNLTPDVSLRVVANYTLVTADDGKQSVQIYGMINAVSPVPQTVDRFKDGIKTDPVSVLSAWMGWNYLNLILEMKAQNGQHLFHFIEDEVLTDAATGHRTVSLTLYHDAGTDVQAYTKRAYLSIPLKQYVTAGVAKVTVHLAVHTYSNEVKHLSFEYNPK